MDIDGFWQLIEEARAGQGAPADADAVAQAAVPLLATLGETGILDFDAVQGQLSDQAYRWDLWAAAYVIRGGCSDDGFDYFRGWLQAQGRGVWESALADPDTLADLVGRGLDAESVDGEVMTAAASAAYAELTGDEDAFLDAVLQREARAEGADGDPSGEEFDFDDPVQLRARLPRLSAIFLPEG